MAEKTKGWDLSEKLAGVSKLDTGADSRPKLEYIDIDLIDPDPENRKNLEGIDKLAQNILLVGLQQPLAVRKHPDVAGRYMAVSGHRRRLAIKSLVDDGEEQFRMTPCLVAEDGESPAMIRLKLLSGNIVTQTLSSAEMAQTAHDIEQCICDLKEEGHEFPGKVRDYVADVLNVSASKLARLKVIRENLVPELRKHWEEGALKESVAYAFAQQSSEVQRLMISQVTRYGSTKREKAWWTERDARDAADRVLQELKPRKGPKGSCEKCDAAERRLARRGTHSEWDDHCRNGSCCHCCPNIGTCEQVCTHLGKEVEKAKAAARDKRAKEKEQKKKQDEPYLKPRIKLWKRFGEARKAAGLTWEEYAKKAHVTCFRREKKIADFEQGEKITMSSGGLPYCGGDGFDEWRIKTLIAAADALNVSLDYLLCRTDDPQPLKPKGKTEKSDSDLSWRSPKDHPAEGLVVVLRFQFDNDRKTTLMGKWKDGAWCFLNGQKTAMQPSAWFSLPAFEKGETPHD